MFDRSDGFDLSIRCASGRFRIERSLADFCSASTTLSVILERPNAPAWSVLGIWHALEEDAGASALNPQKPKSPNPESPLNRVISKPRRVQRLVRGSRPPGLQ